MLATALTIALVSSLTIGAVYALASDPSVATTTGGGSDSDRGKILPLTPEQQVILDQKMAELRAMEDALAWGDAPGPIDGPEPLPSPHPSRVLPTYPRHQYRYFYCGPATVQVASNLSWDYYYSSTSGETGATNKHKQTTISATWTHTNSSGTTDVNMVAGMNGASHLPYTPFYFKWSNPVFQDFHNAIIMDTDGYGMALAVHVNPRDTVNGNYYLPNWAGVDPSSGYGHYIAINGYSGLYSDPVRWAYYDDSSGGVDEYDGHTVILGSTGAYRYGSYGLWETMRNGNNYLIW